MDMKPSLLKESQTLASERQPPERTFNLCFVLNLTFIAAIGGLLFGYDTGVIAGANLFLENTFEGITDEEKELIVSIAVAAAAVGSIVGGPLSDHMGRRPTVLIADLMFTAGAVVMAIAPSIAVLVVGRLIVGFGVGIAAMVVPVYLAEISPTKVRGTIVTANVLAITFGQFASYLVCLALGTNWRLMLGFAGIPSVVQFVGMLFLPESPRWLMKKGEDERARRIMTRILKEETEAGRDELRNEITLIQEGIEREGDISQKEIYK